MQSRAMEILVGVFICLGVAAIFILTLRVSNFSATTGTGYTLVASFNNVGGLQAGAPVTMAGVQIGRVTSIKLNERTYRAVVKLHIDAEYEVPRGSIASILTSGLLGSNYIGITPGGSLKNMQPGDSFVVTQSALILEHLIGQFITRMGGSSQSSNQGSNQSSNQGSSGAKQSAN